MSTSRSVKRIGTFLVALLGGLAVALGPATVANAHPDITSFYCVSSAGYFDCEVQYVGGVEPVTIKWYFNGYYQPQWDNHTYMSGTCAIHRSYRVAVTLTDIGGTNSQSGSFYCLGWE